MKRILFVAAMAVLALTACQKNITDDITPPTGGGGTGSGGSGGSGGGGGGGPVPLGLLVKQTIRSGPNDSVVYTFNYDANKRLIAIYRKEARTGVGTINDWTKYNRDAAGNVIQVVTRTIGPTPGMADTTIYTLYFTPGTYRFYATKRLSNISGGVNEYDSTAYTHDANGRAIEKVSWVTNTATGAYYRYIKYNYTYDAAGNLTSISSGFASGAATETERFTYDTKTAPLVLGNEALIDYTSNNFMSPNNSIRREYQYTSGIPPSNYTGNITYTYNTNNKPASGMAIYTGTYTATVNITYEYN